MRDSSLEPDTNLPPDRASATRTSRWQMVVGIIGLVVILVLGIRFFGPAFGGTEGGGGHVPPAGVPNH